MIAFLGLGRMGRPMARRLLDAGYDLVVWNRTAARADDLAAAGARVAPTPADAVRDADVVVTMLADPPAVEQVVGSIGPALRPDARLVDMSSVGPDTVRAMAGRVPSLVDAPVMGSVDRAAAGTLTVLAGGDVEPVRGILETFGSVVPCGAIGAGAARKVLLINAMIGGVALVADLLELGRSLGVDDPLGALDGGPLAGAVGRARATDADYPVRLAAKDVGIALGAADLPVLAAVAGRLRAAGQESDLARVATPAPG